MNKIFNRKKLRYFSRYESFNMKYNFLKKKKEEIYGTMVADNIFNCA